VEERKRGRKKRARAPASASAAGKASTCGNLPEAGGWGSRRGEAMLDEYRYEYLIQYVLNMWIHVFSKKKNWALFNFGTVAFLFLFDKYYLIID